MHSSTPGSTSPSRTRLLVPRRKTSAITTASTPTDSTTVSTDWSCDPNSPATATPVARLDATSVAPIAASRSRPRSRPATKPRRRTRGTPQARSNARVSASVTPSPAHSASPRPMASAGPLPSMRPTLSRICGPSNRQLGEHRVDDVRLQLLVALKHEAEDGGQGQQQREDREERVVRDQRREPAGTVVDELAPDRHRERDGGMAPLPAVDGHAPILSREASGAKGARPRAQGCGLHCQAAGALERWGA